MSIKQSPRLPIRQAAEMLVPFKRNGRAYAFTVFCRTNNSETATAEHRKETCRNLLHVVFRRLMEQPLENLSGH